MTSQKSERKSAEATVEQLFSSENPARNWQILVLLAQRIGATEWWREKEEAMRAGLVRTLESCLEVSGSGEGEEEEEEKNKTTTLLGKKSFRDAVEEEKELKGRENLEEVWGKSPMPAPVPEELDLSSIKESVFSVAGEREEIGDVVVGMDDWNIPEKEKYRAPCKKAALEYYTRREAILEDFYAKTANVNPLQIGRFRVKANEEITAAKRRAEEKIDEVVEEYLNSSGESHK